MKAMLHSKLGMPTIIVVTINPMMPNCEVRIKLKGKPMAQVRMASFRLNFVSP